MTNPNNVPVSSMSYEQQQAEIARLMAELAKAGKAKKDTFKLGSGLSCAVSEKGAVSIYGLGRFPVTLYKSQLAAIVLVIPQLQAFIQANGSKLKDKPTKPA